MIFFYPFMSLFLLILTGCMVGPKYERPAIKLPEKYAEYKDQSTLADLASWWTFFDDPYLTKLVEKAVAQNYSFRIACEKIVETRAFFMVQYAKLFPEVDAVAQLNRTHFSQNVAQTASLTNQTDSYFQAGLDALWELDLWGKLRHAKRGAYNEYQAHVESMRDVYLTLLGDITKAYIECRAFQKKIDLLTQRVALDTKLFSLTSDRFHAGVDSSIPDSAQHAVLCESKNQLLLAQTGLTQAITRLAMLLGENPEDFVLSPGDHKVPQSTKSLDVGLPSELVRRRPDIRQAERLLAAATEYVGEAVAQWFPRFSLLGSVAYEANKSSKWFSSKSISWSIGPSMTWPIITFGRIKYIVEEKKSVRRQALFAYCQSIINAFGDVEHALVAYFNGKKQVALIHKKVHQALKQKNATRELFVSGLSSELDALVAEKNYVDTELELIDYEQLLSISLIAVYKALGGGW